MTSNGRHAHPLDKAAIREPFWTRSSPSLESLLLIIQDPTSEHVEPDPKPRLCTPLMSFFPDALSAHRLACAAVCPGHCQRNDREQSCKFGGVGDVGVFDVESTRFGIGKKTLDPPPLPVEVQRIFGRRDICGDQK